MITKKPKFWDLKKPNLLANILLPLTLFIKLNNFFLKFKSKKKFSKIKTICVGNIYLGGTGKTPTTIKLNNLLLNYDFKVATGKKFYFNQKDEQILLNKKTQFITSKNRIDIIKSAIDSRYDFLIFDDGLQDREIDYDIKFVCFDCKNWIGNGCLIPSGPLRESLNNLKKYDGIFLKSSDKISNLDTIHSIIKNFNKNIKIFHSKVKIINLKKFNLSEKYLIFSGIGNNKSFKELLDKNKFNIVKEIYFPDHYNYNVKDISKILKKARDLGVKIITTEKDYVKIPEIYKNNFNYLEIDLNIIEQEELIKFIKSKFNETN